MTDLFLINRIEVEAEVEAEVEVEVETKAMPTLCFGRQVEVENIM